MSFIQNIKTTIKRLPTYHIYYRRSGFYNFLWKTIINLFIIIGGLVGIFLLIDYYVIDFNELFNDKLAQVNKAYIYGIFFLSETLFGMLPPDFFIAWSEHEAYPLLALSFLALLSYLGGAAAFGLGKVMRKVPVIKRIIEEKLENQAKFVRKWGVLFVIVAALLPLPYATVSMAAGAIEFPFWRYAFWGLTRFLRFYGYAVFIFWLL